MSAPAAPHAPKAAGHRQDLRRWRRRSRLIGVLRKLLPAAIVLLLLSLAGQVLWTSLAVKKTEAQETPVAIRMLNPRFFGRDEQGRSFMISAREAIRDDRDLRRVILDHPVVGLATDTPEPSRVSAKSGIYTEADRMLRLNGEVRIEDDGPVGQVNSDSYGVYEKGDRVVFKGGVRARITGE
jgi:lipopolysaccharide export system protein LptC